MESILKFIGVMALAVPAIAAFIIVLSMWGAWWTFPLWQLVMVPLGLPAIGYWHYMGLVAVLRYLTHHSHPTDYARDEEASRARQLAGIFFSLLLPVVTYYFVMWCLRG